MSTLRKKKPSKSVEKAARSVKDSDDFVQHIANIADRYRREHALDLGPRARAVRQSLRAFHKHAAAEDAKKSLLESGRRESSGAQPLPLSRPAR